MPVGAVVCRPLVAGWVWSVAEALPVGVASAGLVSAGRASAGWAVTVIFWAGAPSMLTAALNLAGASWPRNSSSTSISPLL